MEIDHRMLRIYIESRKMSVFLYLIVAYKTKGLEQFYQFSEFYRFLFLDAE